MIDAFEFVFDRFLDGDDAFVNRGMVLAMRSNKEDFSLIIPYVRFKSQSKPENLLVLDTSVIIDGRIADLIEAKFVEGEEYFAAGQQTQGHAFAIDSGHGRDADVDLLAFDPNVNAAVLGQAFFGDVHA